MLNFIIYEDNELFMKKNVDSINIVLAKYDLDYKIQKFNGYSSALESIIKDKSMKKIYILDVEVGDVSGIELASKIREFDWDSVIIIATSYCKYQEDVFYTRLMVLDFICKYSGYENRLIDDIKTSLDIIDNQKAFVFKYNHTVHRIPYNQICYIEKEPIIKRCIIHTYNGTFHMVGTINGILERLDNHFLKTHQSCIINLDSVKSLNLAENTIVFNDGEETNMLTDKMKKEMKKYVGIS